MILFEETTPFIVEQAAVGLNAIVYDASVGVLAMKVHGFAIETDRPHQRFATMPGKEHLLHGLRLYVLLGE